MSPLDSAKVQELADRATHLTALKNSPSYPTFKQILEEKINRETRVFLRTAKVSQQELDYGRGLLWGLKNALDVIERGEEEFEKAMKMARAIEEVEGS